MHPETCSGSVLEIQGPLSLELIPSPTPIPTTVQHVLCVQRDITECCLYLSLLTGSQQTLELHHTVCSQRTSLLT